MSSVLSRARTFLLTHARLLERRIFEARFEGAPPALAGQAVRAYQNADGGLGHALEPDVRCPESQPLFIGIGLEALEEAGCRDAELAEGICAFLDTVSDDKGLVTMFSEAARNSPVAAHWVHSSLETGINPTAAICGLLHYQGVEHPWLTRATKACVGEILGNTPAGEAHALRCAAQLAQYLPDRETAARLAERIARALPRARFYIAEAPAKEYGLTPFDFAPRPDSMLRPLFTQSQIDGHLKDLLGRQQPDGGWPITWDAPGPAAAAEWRGRVTLEAVLRLSAYGII